MAAATHPEAQAARLRQLLVHDFRNLENVELDVPAPGLVLIGDNGHGKTNMLEAIHYLHLLRSMRGAHDAELIRFGMPLFHVGARMHGPHGAVAAGYERASGRKRVAVDGVIRTKLSEAFGALPSVAFAPSDVGIVSGAPALRRRLLDVALASTSQRYLLALQQYRVALAQRNASLRRGGSAAHVALWEGPLADHGAYLRRERAVWVAWARDQLATVALALGERDELGLRYRSGVEAAPEADEGGLREALAAALSRHRERDLARGATLTGPHRDDLDVRLGAVSLRRFGSAGQQRTAAIALRLLERAWYRERTGWDPIVLLDDPLAELDPGRAARVLSLLASRPTGQAVLAVPREDDVPAALASLARFRVRDGVVWPESGE